MKTASLLVLAAFVAIVSCIEIPKMLKSKYYNELLTFIVLILFGAALAVMKIFDITIPNISSVFTWLYSPLKNIIKWLTES